MLLGRHTCTIDLITLGTNLMCHSSLTNLLRQSYLYKWFDHTWQEHNVSFHFGKRSCTNELITLGRNFQIFLFWPMILGRHTCKSELLTYGRNLMYHSILTNVFTQTYLYKLFNYTWQESNVSFNAYQCSLIDILVRVIWSLLAGTGSILTNSLRQTYFFKCWQNHKLSFRSDLCY